MIHIHFFGVVVVVAIYTKFDLLTWLGMSNLRVQIPLLETNPNTLSTNADCRGFVARTKLSRALAGYAAQHKSTLHGTNGLSKTTRGL